VLSDAHTALADDCMKSMHRTEEKLEVVTEMLRDIGVSSGDRVADFLDRFRPVEGSDTGEDNVKGLRHKLNISQAALADRLLVSKRSVENWESGTRKTPPSVLQTLKCLVFMEGIKDRIKELDSSNTPKAV
jgi:DNA-binding transcriptional regulator YiaG